MNGPTESMLPVVTDCRSCGACCLHMVYPPFYSRWPLGTKGNDPGWERLVAERPDLAADIESRYEGRVARGLNSDNHEAPCHWFDSRTRSCKHHEYRPDICADFEVGGEDCRDARIRCGIEETTP